MCVYATRIILVLRETEIPTQNTRDSPMSASKILATRASEPADWTPSFSPWRHGGWYVHNCRYPSGAVGCVSRNYPDGKWRIVCDEREGDHTDPTRVEAACAEYAIATGKP